MYFDNYYQDNLYAEDSNSESQDTNQQQQVMATKSQQLTIWNSLTTQIVQTVTDNNDPYSVISVNSFLTGLSDPLYEWTQNSGYQLTVNSGVATVLYSGVLKAGVIIDGKGLFVDVPYNIKCSLLTSNGHMFGYGFY